MGVSILRRGIHRAEGGMRTFFRALLSDARGEGAQVLWHRRAIRIETAGHTPGGPAEKHWRVTLRSTKDGSTSVVTVRRGLVCNLTLWDLCDIVVPTAEVMATRTYRGWKEATAAEEGWGAFALYAFFQDKPSIPETPWFHQVFARERDKGTLAHEANYVSISGRADSSNPKGGRLLTSTLHVPARVFSAQERAALMNALVERTEHALGVKLENVESATPETYARFTGRKNGQVGGFKMSRARFLFNAPPSFLRVSGVPAPLAVAGDTVFPGQGVIACLLSGIIAWERITGRSFRDLR